MNMNQHEITFFPHTQGPVTFKDGDRVGITQIEQLQGKQVITFLLYLSQKSKLTICDSLGFVSMH